MLADLLTPLSDTWFGFNVFRYITFRTGLAIAPRYPLGAGYGTFEPLFRMHQPAAVEGRWTHAHNDWLEALLEGGPLAVLLLAWLLGGLLLVTRGGAGRLTGEPAILAGSATAGIVAIAAHSMLDFTLRIPAAAVVAAFLFGLVAACWRGVIRNRVRSAPPGSGDRRLTAVEPV